MNALANRGLDLMARFLGVTGGHGSTLEVATSLPEARAFTNNGTWYADKARKRAAQESVTAGKREAAAEALRSQSVAHRHDDLKRKAMIGAAVVGVLAGLVGIGIASYDGEARPAAFACQHGDPGAACIPVRERDGSWTMAGLDRDGTLSEVLASHALYPLLVKGGIQFHGTKYVKTGKFGEEVLDFPWGARIPVLMPDGSLAVAPAANGHVMLADAHRIADAANPARPETMLDEAAGIHAHP